MVAAARDPKAASALQELAKEANGRLQLVALDVSSVDSAKVWWLTQQGTLRQSQFVAVPSIGCKVAAAVPHCLHIAIDASDLHTSDERSIQYVA